MSTGLTVAVLAMVVLVLARDLGHRKISWIALLRPIVLPLVVIPFIGIPWNFSGNGLLLEAAAVLVGLGVGALAGAFMKVSRDTAADTWTDAAAAYAAVWIVVTAARQLLIYGAQHWFTRDLGLFLMDHHIAVAAFADSMLFLSILPVIGNRLLLLLRVTRLHSRTDGGATSDLTPAPTLE
jgi:hypothetical protein